ncbi:LamG-like jellyroll fold domain-containing protein [Cellvibrio sp. QJXJ]|uniref:LamG-like jellyroll fold domain-containing protein n=1 Tax=Cellvibrio sp. QJXJ TaxID=2964606 RepID=UPI0021C260C4|nr:LamG-like jellyroll fold domain-containing protein [Cellvibrio sp. QJXJ]UUA74738.1 family 43 glycosylhydrolase [Cellvibrio sp. QJXJ]
MKLHKLALLISGAVLVTACGGGSDNKGSEIPANVVPENVSLPNPTVNAEAIVYNDMAVHDPSIIKAADGTFYVFGSHLSVAKSTDLMSWTRVADGVNDQNPLFNTYSSEIAEGIAWTDGYVGNWAANVVQAPNGKYWFYYNHCGQNHPDEPVPTEVCFRRSYLGLAEADSIEGPYVDKGVFLRSDYRSPEEFASFPLDNGQTTYDGAVDPNVIDPTTFFDKNNQMWMVYGSFSGGIFILRMDETTGKPKPGQGYGKRLTGGGFATVEGSFIYYNPDADYYYMFTSIGGFNATGGYNIRVSRSKNPDGPYVDAAGNDMLLARNNLETLSKYGVKLMGGFNFVSEVGDAAESWGYLAPGHNSAYYDAATKKNFLVTHTRFPNRGEEHSVRVHEMWVNKDGWLVSSPQRYAPIEGTNVVDANDLVGDYRFINHGLDTNSVAHNSVYIRLNDDRTITGEVSGYYRLSDTDNKRITLVLGSDTYEGVMAWQWDAAAARLVPTFSAISTKGVSVWGSQLEARTTGENLTAIADDLSLPAEYVDPTMTVPLRGTRAAEITWVSSNPAVINLKRDKKTGELTGVAHVNRPSATAGDQDVTLTATITLNGETQTKNFIVKVLAVRLVPAAAQFKFDGDLTEATGTFAAGSTTGDRIFNTGGTAAYGAGIDGQAINLNGYGVLLPQGLISNYEYTVSFWLKPTAITAFTTAFFGAVDTEQWLSFLPEGWNGGTMLWARTPNWYDGIAGLKVPEGEWTQMVFSVDKGEATIYINGVKKHVGQNFGDLFTNNNALFALGVNYWDLPLNGLVDDLKIYNQVLTPDEVALMDPGSRPAAEVLELAANELILGDLSALKDDIDLPLAGPYTTAISWSSSNPSLIDAVGTIVQPSATEPDGTATLTATISYGGATVTKAFDVVVKSKAPPVPLATFSFEDNLSEANGAHADGTVVGNRVNVAGGSVSYVDGAKGKALVLDGNSGVLLPDNLINDHSYSISIWLNLTAGTQYTPAFFGWATDSSWISVVPRGPGDAQNTMLWSGTAWYDGTFNAKIPTGSWSHLVMVVENGRLTTYINGAQTSTMAGFPDVFTPAGDTHFALGVNYWDIPYNGQVDELKIYDEVLTADDVAIINAQDSAE